MDIVDTVALVTGGASGLGRATAEALLAAGGRVVILDLPESAGQELETQHPDAVRFVPGDVRREADVAAALDAAAELGTLRIAVNCAGTGQAGRTVGRDGPYPLEAFERIVGINLVGTFNVIRLAAERIGGAEPIAGERGVVVNTASVAAFEGQIGQVAYSASKGGIVGMTLPIARDLATMLIRVVTIAPGLFDTPLLGRREPEKKAALAAQVPHPARLGDATEYAMLVTHIVNNPMLNGETIRLDGAIRMTPR